MVQGISSPFPAQPNQPQQVAQSQSAAHVGQSEPQVTESHSLEIEISLPGLDAAALQGTPAAAIEANQLRFEQISSRIIAEVQRVQRIDQPATLVIRLGDRLLSLDAGMLDKGRLQQALQAHFGEALNPSLSPAPGLGDPEHLEAVQQLQAQSRSILVRILQQPDPATPADPPLTPAVVAPAENLPGNLPEASRKQLKTLVRQFEKEVPAKLRDAYGLSAEALTSWAETGQPPAGLMKLSQDYGPKTQPLYAAILHVLGYGRAVVEARAKAGLVPPDQARESLDALAGIKTDAGRKWEALNASAVADTRKVATQALGRVRQAEAELKALEAGLQGQIPDAAQAKALAAAQAKTQQALAAAIPAQAQALSTAHAIKDVRLRRVELAGGAAAPEPVRIKVAHAVLDAAGAEAQDAQLSQLSGGDPKPAVGRSQQLLSQAEAYAPNWRQDQGLIRDRTAVLEGQREALRPEFEAVAQRKQQADLLTQLRQQLAGLPPKGHGLESQDVQRVRLQEQIEDLAATLATTLGPAAGEDSAGASPSPAERELIQLQVRSTAALSGTYAADLALHMIRPLSDTQRTHLQDISRKSRALHVEIAGRAHDGLDTASAESRALFDQAQWQRFGRADAEQAVAAAQAELGRWANDTSTDGQIRITEAQFALAAALQKLRDGQAATAVARQLPSAQFAAHYAHDLATEMGADGLAGLAQSSEARALSDHTQLGSTYVDARGSDPAWLAENGQFLRSRAQLATRGLGHAQAQVELATQQDQAQLREAAVQRGRLTELKTQLQDLAADAPERKALLAERNQLEQALAAFGDTSLGIGGPELADRLRRGLLLDAPLARMRELRAETDANVTLMRKQLAAAAPAHQLEWRQQTLLTVLAAAETFPKQSPGTAAAYLREAGALAASLPTPAARHQAQLEIKQRALEIYKAYVQHPHSEAGQGAAELASAVASAVYPHGQGAGLPDGVMREWEALRAQSDPTQLFATHRDELREALGILQAQVAGDIETCFKLAVDRGGLAVGTAARAARALAQDGDIAGAKALLAAAVNQAIAASEQAEAAFRSLPPARQEQYRAVLRSSAEPAQKQDALEAVFGYRIGGDEAANAGAARFAVQALRVASGSQTMQRAYQPGSDYHSARSALATAAALRDPSAGLRPSGGAEADAIAARHAYRRSRDEAYWNQPAIAVLASAVDEAALFALTLGASTAFSLAKASVTGVRAIRASLSLARRGQTLLEANRLGRTALTVGGKLAGANQALTRGLAGLDGALMGGGRLAQTAGWGVRGMRGMARNLAIEKSLQGAGQLAEQVAGKDSWLSMAVNLSGRMMSVQVGEIKGLDALENALWNVGETLAVESLLPAYYAGDPAGLAAARDELHYLLMGVQTVHGMAKMRSQAQDVAGFEAAGLRHDLETAGIRLDGSQQAALNAEVTRYHEALLHNQGSLNPAVHTEFAQRITALSGLDQLPTQSRAQAEPLLRQALDSYLAPYRIQVAAFDSKFRLDPETATPKMVETATTAMATELLTQGAAKTQAEGLHIARGQLAAQLMQQARFGAHDYSRDSDSLRSQLRADMDLSARRLLELGLADNPAAAMLIVRAELRQHLADAASRIPSDSPADQAAWAGVKANLAHVERYTDAFGQTLAVIDGALPRARELQASLIERLMMPQPDLSLAQQLRGQIYESLRAEAGTSPDALTRISREAMQLSRELVAGWSERELRLERLSDPAGPQRGLTLQERHRQLLGELGLSREDAAQAAHDGHLKRVAVELSDGLAPAQTAGVRELMLQHFAELGRAQNTSEQALRQREDSITRDLEQLGIAAAPALARKLLAQGVAYAGFFQGVEGLQRQRSLDNSLADSLGLPMIQLDGQALTRLSELRAWLTPETLANPDKMMALYTQLGGWQTMHELANWLPAELFGRVHEVRDAKIKGSWERIAAQAAAEGLSLAKPYVGRGPDDVGYTGAYADLDLVVRITASPGLDQNAIARKELELVKALQEDIGRSFPASGHQVDVNVYPTPHFLPIGLPGGSVSASALQAQHHNALMMDFVQLRQGLSDDGAWARFQQQALGKAAGRGEQAVSQLKQGFAFVDSFFAAHAAKVSTEMTRLQAAHSQRPTAMLAEQARSVVRQAALDDLGRFLKDNASLLKADTPEGAATRVEYDRLQMVLRAISPEAYAGNAAVFWGARGGGAETLAPLGGNADAGLQGRVSHGQYILHWIHDSHADLPTQAWKAGKYDQRDQIFLDAVNLDGPRIIEMAPNPDYQAVKKNPAYDPRNPLLGPEVLPLSAADNPALEVPHPDFRLRREIPRNKMDLAAFEARAQAQTPTQALQIWMRHYGSEAAALQAMGDYVQMLNQTVQDSSALHLMQSAPTGAIASAWAERAVPASELRAAGVQHAVARELAARGLSPESLPERLSERVQAHLEAHNRKALAQAARLAAEAAAGYPPSQEARLIPVANPAGVASQVAAEATAFWQSRP